MLSLPSLTQFCKIVLVEDYIMRKWSLPGNMKLAWVQKDYENMLTFARQSDPLSLENKQHVQENIYWQPRCGRIKTKARTFNSCLGSLGSHLRVVASIQPENTKNA